MLDNGDIDYAILDVLDGLIRTKFHTVAINTEYARQEFMKYNMIKALLDTNILFKSKYYDQLNLEHHLYHDVLEKYVKDKKQQMNGYENFRYKVYKKVKGLKFGSGHSGVPF